MPCWLAIPQSVREVIGRRLRHLSHPCNELLVLALRASAGRHAEAARNVVLTIVFLQMLAGSGHDGPPHGSPRAPRRGDLPKARHAYRPTVTGRRPRG